MNVIEKCEQALDEVSVKTLETIDALQGVMFISEEEKIVVQQKILMSQLTIMTTLRLMLKQIKEIGKRLPTEV